MTVSFNPLEFLTLAAQLADPPAEESELRTAVGRVYQALHLLAREKLGIKPGKSEKIRTKNALRRKDPSAKQQLGYLGKLRIHADYLLVPTPPYDGTWEDNWSEAQQLLRHIKPKLERL